MIRTPTKMTPNLQKQPHWAWQTSRGHNSKDGTAAFYGVARLSCLACASCEKYRHMAASINWGSFFVGVLRMSALLSWAEEDIGADFVGLRAQSAAPEPGLRILEPKTT